MDLRAYKEETCKRCGICCHVKIVFMGKVYIDMSQPCPFLDQKTNLCTVYEERFVKQPRCRQLYVVMDQEDQPNTCGYVEELKEAGGKYTDPIVVENLGEIPQKKKD